MVTHPSFSPPESAGADAPGMKAQVRGLADDVKKDAGAFAEQHKSDGADRLQKVSETVSRVADEVETESPQVADFVRKAASSLDSVSRDLKDKSVGDLLDMAKTFARREPAAFLAASAVAGFALSRLMKSSSSGPGGPAAPVVASATGGQSPAHRYAAPNFASGSDEFAAPSIPSDAASSPSTALEGHAGAVRPDETLLNSDDKGKAV